MGVNESALVLYQTATSWTSQSSANDFCGGSPTWPGLKPIQRVNHHMPLRKITMFICGIVVLWWQYLNHVKTCKNPILSSPPLRNPYKSPFVVYLNILFPIVEPPWFPCGKPNKKRPQHELQRRAARLDGHGQVCVQVAGASAYADAVKSGPWEWSDFVVSCSMLTNSPICS